MVEGLELVRPEAQEAFEPDGHWGVDTRWLVRAGEQLRFQVVEMAAGGGADPHVHDAEEQVFYLLEGRLQVAEAGGAPVLVERGQALRIPAGVSHGTRNPDDGPTRYLVLTYPAPS